MTPSEQAERLWGLADLLLPWYDQNKRPLPWRRDRDPYRVWVSEIMLQQTRAETVKPYFLRFVDKLPTVKDLAEAEEGELLKLWEGLGYYSRVRNLKKGAQAVMERYGGKIPADVDALRSLPGVGPYTAGAIASIAFDIPAPAVDGNVLRVMARLMGYEENVLAPATRVYVEQTVKELIPARAGDFTQGLIELGALVCLPGGEAKCEACPLSLLCRAARSGADTVARLPIRQKNTARRIEQRTVLILMDPRGRVAVRRRPGTGLLAGLYEFPHGEGHWHREDVLAWLGREGIPVKGEPERLTDAKHLFSHIEWQMQGYAVRVDQVDHQDLLFVTKEELDTTCAVPSAFRAYRRWVDTALCTEERKK